MATIEISKNRLPRRIWMVKLINKDKTHTVELVAFLVEDIKNKRYLPEVLMRDVNDVIQNITLPGVFLAPQDFEKLNTKFDSLLSSVTEDYSRARNHVGALIEEINVKSQNIEDIRKEIEKIGIFEFKTEVRKQDQPAPIPALEQKDNTQELTEMLLKFKPKELQAMVDKITVPKLKIKYGEEAVSSFLQKIKYVQK